MKQELIKAFANDKFGNVRVVLVGTNQEPYFVGKDVAESLGYSNASKAVSTHVDEEDRILETIEAHSQNGNAVKTQTTLINESGLYSLILSSKLPSAKEFKHWVTAEVLPSIRQHGAYLTSEIRERLKENSDYIIELVQKLEDKELEIKELEQVNELLARNYNDIRLMYQNCTNEVAEYVISNLTYKRSGKIRCNDLYNHYCIWCKDTPHYEPYDRKKFEELLLERMVQGHSIIKNGNYYMGIEKRV